MNELLLLSTLIFLTWGIGASLLAFRFYKLTSSMTDELRDKNTQIKEMRRELSEQEIELDTLQMKLDALERTMESMRSFDEKLTGSRRVSSGSADYSRTIHKLREGNPSTFDVAMGAVILSGMEEDSGSSGTSNYSNDDSGSSYSGSYSGSSSSFD